MDSHGFVTTVGCHKIIQHNCTVILHFVNSQNFIIHLKSVHNYIYVPEITHTAGLFIRIMDIQTYVNILPSCKCSVSVLM